MPFTFQYSFNFSISECLWKKLQAQYPLFLLPLSNEVMLTLIIIPGSAATITEFDFWGSFFDYFRLGGVHAFCLFFGLLGQGSGSLTLWQFFWKNNSSGSTIGYGEY